MAIVIRDATINPASRISSERFWRLRRLAVARWIAEVAAVGPMLWLVYSLTWDYHVAVMLLALFNGRLTFGMLQGVCHTSARTVAMIFFIIISATCFAYVYRSLGGDDIVEHLILESGLGSWGLLILIMAITFCLGFFLDWIEITLIVLPVFAPMVAGFDFGSHIAQGDIIFWFIILMAINLQTSFLTPPFGFALFYLKGIAPKEIKIQSIYKGIIPFVLLQLIGLILVMWQPNVALSLMSAVYDY